LNGYLLLGTAETTNEFSIYFDSIENRLRIYQKVKDLRIPISSMNGLNVREKQSYHVKSVPQFISKSKAFADRNPSSTQRITSVIQEALLEEFLPPTLVFNQRLQLIFSFGDTSIFTAKIKPGRVSNELSDILIPEVANTALSAAHEVIKDGKSVLYEAAHLSKVNDKELAWSIKAVPIDGDKDLDESSVAISFIEENNDRIIKSDRSYKSSELDSHKINQLDQALLDCQELYREALENLDTTSEELQSSNEELMAANEELQSTNEELQSVNEELYTVNSEYQQKILELSNTNNDLEALLKATNLAIIFLDRHLNIRRFTEAVKEFVNIIDYDIDRDFSDLTLKFEMDNLYDKIVEVNKSGESIIETFDVEEGKIKVQLIPYSHRNLRIGIVVTLSWV
jgi:two-component system CheB/CheR fusion protein